MLLNYSIVESNNSIQRNMSRVASNNNFYNMYGRKAVFYYSLTLQIITILILPTYFFWVQIRDTLDTSGIDDN